MMKTTAIFAVSADGVKEVAVETNRSFQCAGRFSSHAEELLRGCATVSGKLLLMMRRLAFAIPPTARPSHCGPWPR